MARRRPGHLATFDYLGCYRYFLTFCTRHRRHAFTSHSFVREVLLRFLRAAREERFEIVAYCFMPDHVHLLVEGTSETSNGKRFFRKAKQYSGHAFRHRPERLWQRDGYERVLRSDEATLAVIRYILENPVRAALVSGPFDYPLSGSERYTTEQLREVFAVSPTDWCPPS